MKEKKILNFFFPLVFNSSKYFYSTLTVYFVNGGGLDAENE